MSARVWTREELDRVHPLRDGWVWDVDFGSRPLARRGTGIGAIAVWVDELGDLVCEKTVEGLDTDEDTMRADPPADVALAVILASKGLDSLEAMAAEAARLRSRVRVEPADVERSGVTPAHAEAWLKARGWEFMQAGPKRLWLRNAAVVQILYGDDTWWVTRYLVAAIDSIGAAYAGGASAMCGLDILDEMARCKP